MKGKINSLSGITLIALVITIIILIILATISVNIVMNGGLIDRTSKGKELHELERERERLELIKGEVASDTNHVGKVTVDTYVEELIHKGITVDKDVTDNGDESKTVITDTGYSVLIKPRGDKDVEIIIEGKAGQLPPRIVNIDLTRDNDAKTIKVDITVKRAEGATYSYYYKIANEDWVEIEKDTDKTSVTVSDIDTDKMYTIKVEATNEYGTASLSKNSEPGPITADKLQRSKYVWYVDSEGTKRKAVVLYDSLEDGGIEICCLDPLTELTMGDDRRTKEAYDKCKKQAHQYKELLNAKPIELVNSTTSISGRALFTSREGNVVTHSSTIAQTPESVSDGAALSDITRMKNYGPENWIAGKRVWIGDMAEYNVASYDPTHKIHIYYFWRGYRNDSTIVCTYVPASLTTAASYTTRANTCSVYGVFRLRDDVVFEDGDGSEEYPYSISVTNE